MEEENPEAAAAEWMFDATDKIFRLAEVNAVDRLAAIRNAEPGFALRALAALLTAMADDGEIDRGRVEDIFNTAERKGLGDDEQAEVARIIRDLWFDIAPLLPPT